MNPAADCVLNRQTSSFLAARRLCDEMKSLARSAVPHNESISRSVNRPRPCTAASTFVWQKNFTHRISFIHLLAVDAVLGKVWSALQQAPCCLPFLVIPHKCTTGDKRGQGQQGSAVQVSVSRFAMNICPPFLPCVFVTARGDLVDRRRGQPLAIQCGRCNSTHFLLPLPSSSSSLLFLFSS